MEQAFLAENPHCVERIANGQLPIFQGPLHWDDLHVSPKSLRVPYQRRTGWMKTVEHWGQRKLLMSEIYFLTQHLPVHATEAVCIYAGSAPGIHIQILLDMFPAVQWILVDPKFSGKSKYHIAPVENRVEIHPVLFTDALALEFRARFHGKLLFFFSDIRAWDKKDGNASLEAAVQRDMQAQKRWVELLDVPSMLKFRLPYTPLHEEAATTQEFPDLVEYLDGKLLFPVWTGATSTECRLIVTDPQSRRMWSSKQHEDVMYAFQTVTRTSRWDFHPDHMRVPGIDHCFDCAAEILILSAYLDIFHGTFSVDLVNQWISHISSVLGVSGRNLARNYTSQKQQVKTLF